MSREPRSATNVDLKQAVANQTFREDPYDHPNVVPIAVLPVRERRGDIPLLVEHFIRRDNAEMNKRIEGLSPEVVAVLRDCPLDLLLPDHTLRLRHAETLPLQQAPEEFERQVVFRVLERVRWNRNEAARALGPHRNSLKTMLACWGLGIRAGD